MGQVPYFPPTVAGWEGGLSWLNTNTALARFGFVGQLLSKRDDRRRPRRDAGRGLRPRLRGGRSTPGWPRRPRPRSSTTPTARRFQHAQAPEGAPAHAPRPDAGRPRRTGDVMSDQTRNATSPTAPTSVALKCADCAHSDSLGHRPEADVDAADPGRGAGRLPRTACRTPSARARGSTAARSCATACSAWRRSTPRRSSTGARSGSRRSPTPPARCRRASSASTSTAATTASTASCRSTRPTSPIYNQQRAEHRPRPRSVDRRQGRHDRRWAAPGGSLGVRQPARLRRRQQRRHA